jgi:hypothetical protein
LPRRSSVFEMSGEIQSFHCWSLGFETTLSHKASAQAAGAGSCHIPPSLKRPSRRAWVHSDGALSVTLGTPLNGKKVSGCGSGRRRRPGRARACKPSIGITPQAG